MNDLISFIIPAYNVEKYIDNCIDSIIHQSKDNWELILVDDGSTDNTAKICDDYAKKDNRIKVIHQKNSGSAVARNSGFDMAQGEWVAFIDGDDWIEADYIDTLQKYMTQSYDFIMYSYNEVNESGIKDMCLIKNEYLLTKEVFLELVKDVIDTEQRVKNVASSRSQFWTKLFRKEFLIKNQIRSDANLRMSQDVLFNLCVYNCADNAVFIPKNLYNYRILGDSTCHRYSTDQVPRILKVMEAISAYSKGISVDEDMDMLCQKRILVSLVNACRLDFCHENNPLEYKKRKEKFLGLRAKEPFASALNVKVIRSFSFKKQICMWFVKCKWFRLLDIFL